MELNLLTYFFCAFAISAIIQFFLIRLTHKRGFFIDDHKSDLPQKLHDVPTPRVGGLGIFLACFFMAVSGKLGLLILIASIPSFLAGIFEDLYSNISPIKRLMTMLISAIFAIWLCDAVVLDFGFIHVPYFVGVIITIVAILGLINGTNMIDGFNGLSSGVSLLIFVAYYFISIKVQDAEMQLICSIIIAAILGFLIFNFPLGKIFLGDGGAYILGFLLAVVSILIVKRNASLSPWFAFVCLIYPVWEVIFSFTRRTVINKLSPLYPDSKHIHQLLYRNVTKQNNPITTLIIYPVIIAMNILAIHFYNNTFALAYISLVFIVCYIIAYKVLLNTQTKKETIV